MLPDRHLFSRNSPGDVLPGHRHCLPPSRTSQKRDLLIHRQRLDELVNVGIQEGFIELVVCGSRHFDSSETRIKGERNGLPEARVLGI
jgi:hypothetical protein